MRERNKAVIFTEWHPDKNGNLSPVDLLPQSNKKVWWLCEKGHEWQAIVQRRYFGDGCPYCRGKLPSKENCLAARKPELIQEWHPMNNKGLTPFDVLPGSDKKVWWMCSEGHEWQTRISHRYYGSGCPYCRKKTKT